MTKHLTDTDSKAEEFQIYLLRRASVAERFALTRSLSRTVMNLSKRAIQRANPGLSEQEPDILFVKYHYGDELAEKLREYVNQIDEYSCGNTKNLT